MKKLLHLAFVVTLAVAQLSPLSSTEGHRHIASINLWSGDYPASFSVYAPPSDIILGLQQFQQNPDNQDLIQQASYYSDIFYLSSMNYLAGLESAQGVLGIKSSLFAPPKPISVANFDPASFDATSSAWGPQDIQKNYPKNKAVFMENQFPNSIPNMVMTNGSPLNQSLKTPPSAGMNFITDPKTGLYIPMPLSPASMAF